MTPSQLAQTIKQKITALPKKQQLILGAAALLLAALVFLHRADHRRNDVVLMQPDAVATPVQLAEQLHIPEAKAKDVAQAIEKAVQKQPAASWSVEANDPKAAAETVSKQIEEKKAPPMPPADKTVVTPKETKVDVYRIDLDAGRVTNFARDNDLQMGEVCVIDPPP